MSENPTKVTLGDREYTLAPQRIGRIGRKLSAVMDLFAGVGGGQVPTEVAPLYDALKVFIPDLDPQWKLAGYASEDAYRARERYEEKLKEARDRYARDQRSATVEVEVRGESETIGIGWDDLTDEEREGFEFEPFEDPYDEAADKSPTPPEIIDTIEAIFALHGGQRLVRLLRNFVTPEMIRSQIKRMQVESALARSQSLQRANGASDPTPSTTPSPTPDEAGSSASPQPDSLTSLTGAE